MAKTAISIRPLLDERPIIAFATWTCKAGWSCTRPYEGRCDSQTNGKEKAARRRLEIFLADLTKNNPDALFELDLRIAEDEPVALIGAKGTAPIFDVDNMLRVYAYDPNLWASTIEHDRVRSTAHGKKAWDHEDSNPTFMKILRERKIPGVGEQGWFSDLSHQHRGGSRIGETTSRSADQ